MLGGPSWRLCDSSAAKIKPLKEIQNRHSVRRYTEKTVTDELIYRLLESARLAPSGSNTQPWHFIVVRDKETKMALAKADHNQLWMTKAPVFLVCVADVCCRIVGQEIRVDETSPQEELKQIIRDTAISITHILLEAEAIGLSTCWTAWFRQDDIRPILKIPVDKYVCGIVTVGYGRGTAALRPRRTLESMVHFEKW